MKNTILIKQTLIYLVDIKLPNLVQSNPPLYRSSLDWRNNVGVGKRRLRESYITKKKHVRDLKISGGIGGRPSTEGMYWGGRLY